MKPISEILINSYKKTEEIKPLDPKSTCLALAYKELIDLKILPKDCFYCAIGKGDKECEHIKFIESRYDNVINSVHKDDGNSAPKNKSMNKSK